MASCAEILLRGLPPLRRSIPATLGCHSPGPCVTEVNSDGSIAHFPVLTSMTLGAAPTSQCILAPKFSFSVWVAVTIGQFPLTNLVLPHCPLRRRMIATAA